MQRLKFFLWCVHSSCFSERDDGAIVHGVIEDGTSKDKTVGKSDGDTNRDSPTKVAEHAAGGRAVEIDSVTDPREQRGYDERLAINGKADVANERAIVETMGFWGASFPRSGSG